ncbi:MAG TPA: ATP-binding cassette domain-containing protein [Deltaproteobacteria bacterium]|nr:ATP-binding cassette domain-containing protein [Deltaproteobacteria bacterium]
MTESTSHSKPLVTLKDITLRLGSSLYLPHTSWEIKTNQHWAVLGPNGSGKSSLVGAIAGIVPVARGKLTYHFIEEPITAIGYVSFGLQQRILARDIEKDEARFFSGDIDSLETVEQLLSEDTIGNEAISDRIDRVLHLMGIPHLLNREIRYLSTGEMRKLLIARALMKDPKILILDEPFDGLDQHSRNKIKNSIIDLIGHGFQIVLVTHRMDELIPHISHVLCLKEGKIIMQGSRDKVFESVKFDRLYDNGNSIPEALSLLTEPFNISRNMGNQVLIEMKGASVKYGEKTIINNLDWTVRHNENWAVAGPNGAGKSTLLKLIVGDNQQVYSNKVRIFGKIRGSGESIWEIKNKIGYISSEFQFGYRKRINAVEVVLSGFFDSIGLYRTASASQIDTAREWLNTLGITHLKNRRFDSLSDGEKRLVLIARVLVKSPLLVILDEPCQGLDPANRKMVLDLVDFVGHSGMSNLLFVTHHANEIPSCITHMLEFKKQPSKDSEYRAIIYPRNR